MSETDPLPTYIADYEVLGKISSGGMGVIYRARHKTIRHVVALKIIRDGALPSDEAHRRFVAEIKAAAALDHENIVKVSGLGEHAGRPFFTMPVFPRTLRDRMGRPLEPREANRMGRPLEPREAASLMAMVARGVQHAHERGVLHRDLKPENILLDDDGRPCVADFGVAKMVDAPGLTAPGALVGTFRYMAPEQARGEGPEITMAVDQYSLGVILYELLTARGAGDPLSAAGTEPPSPRALAPRVSRDLDAVCTKCLARDRHARYRSVAELADDLDRVVRGEPTLAGSSSLPARAWRFARRHRLAVAAGASTVALLIMVAVGATLVAHAQERNELQANSFAAQALTGEVHAYLQAQVAAVDAAVAEPELARKLAAGPADAAVGLAEAREHSQFGSMWACDTTGTLIAQTDGTEQHNKVGVPYGWRDYYQQVKEHVQRGMKPAAYIALAVESEVDRQYKFIVAAPFYDERKQWRGVVVGTTATGPLAFQNADLVWHDGSNSTAEGQTTLAVLVAPQDRSRDDASRKGSYVVIVHDALEPGAGVPLDTPALRELVRTRRDTAQLEWGDRRERLPITSDDYRDPLPGWSNPRWLAAYAPVAHTGFVVIVQTRYDNVVSGLLYPIAWVFAAAFVAWGVVFAWRRVRRRGSRAPTEPGCGGLDSTVLLPQS